MTSLKNVFLVSECVLEVLSVHITLWKVHFKLVTLDFK